MPLVPVRGRLYDHAHVPFPIPEQAELAFVPNASQPTRELGGIMPGTEVVCENFTPGTGEFFVELYSDGTDRVSYTPVVRWLVSEDAFERKARGFTEFPPFLPDQGGNIAELYRNSRLPGAGSASWYVASDAANPSAPYQMQLNPDTWNVYERTVV